MESKESSEKTVGKKRRLLLLIIKIILIILLIHLILILTKCSTTDTVTAEEKIPIVETELADELTEVCEDEEFKWSYQWGEWNPEVDGVISTNFFLINDEPRVGTFIVNFAFFDNSLYPYEKFAGIDYDLVRDILPWDAAEMWAEDVKVKLGSYESILITPTAKKVNQNTQYWVYADVTEPTYRSCYNNYKLVEKNKTSYETRQYIRYNNNTITLWDYVLGMVIKD